MWSIGDSDIIMIKGVGTELYLRPRPATPAGVEAFIEVKTRSLHRIFLVRVVERAEDATQRLVVPAAVAECTATAPDVSSAAPPPEPPASAAAKARTPEDIAPAAPEPTLAPAGPAPTTEATRERTGAAGSSRLALSVHAVFAPAGTTELTVPGFTAVQARQSHRALGMRIDVGPRDTFWAVEVNVSGEWPVAPTKHNDSIDVGRTVSGPSLRADAGLRGRFGTPWSFTAYAGAGLQAHHRDVELTEGNGVPVKRMPFEGVLALGTGLEYRTNNLLLGLELHLRQGVPDSYHSVAVFLSAGWLLDQGE